MWPRWAKKREQFRGELRSWQWFVVSLAPEGRLAPFFGRSRAMCAMPRSLGRYQRGGANACQDQPGADCLRRHQMTREPNDVPRQG